MIAPAVCQSIQRLTSMPPDLGRTLNCSIDVGVIEDDERRIPSSLDGDSGRQRKRHSASGESALKTTTHFLSVLAAMPYSIFATGVLPVKDTFFTAVFSHISRPTSATFAWVVTTLMTPGGTPARVAS